jgi:hypothetical protein
MPRSLMLVALLAGCSDRPIDLGGPVDGGARRDLASRVDLAMTTGGISIEKTGPPAPKPMDPGLNSASDCPDQALEPNDSPAQALSFTPQPNQSTARIVQLAICPAGAHDQDWFKVDNNGNGELTLMAQVFYDVGFGDLDVAIVDESGKQLDSDGSGVSNGCAVAPIGNGVYYVVVIGAQNKEVNRYQTLIRSFTGNMRCP